MLDMGYEVGPPCYAPYSRLMRTMTCVVVMYTVARERDSTVHSTYPCWGYPC